MTVKVVDMLLVSLATVGGGCSGSFQPAILRGSDRHQSMQWQQDTALVTKPMTESVRMRVFNRRIRSVTFDYLYLS